MQAAGEQIFGEATQEVYDKFRALCAIGYFDRLQSMRTRKDGVECPKLFLVDSGGTVEMSRRYAEVFEHRKRGQIQKICG